MTELTHNRRDCTGTFKPNGLDRDHGKTYCVFLCSGWEQPWSIPPRWSSIPTG